MAVATFLPSPAAAAFPHSIIIGSAVPRRISVSSTAVLADNTAKERVYPEAVPATLKLLPPSYRQGALQEDYTAMRNMLYGEIPSFETMMEAVGELEKEIHAL